METPNVAEWFEEGELEFCPHCRENRVIPRGDGGELICLNCGPLSAVETPLDGDPGATPPS